MTELEEQKKLTSLYKFGFYFLLVLDLLGFAAKYIIFLWMKK